MARVLLTGMSGAGKSTLLAAVARGGYVIYLHVPLEVLLHRARTRTNNPYGKTVDHQTDIVRYVAEVEPLIRRTASLELDGLLPVPALADRVERCLRSS